jgi:hypothetical protein
VRGQVEDRDAVGVDDNPVLSRVDAVEDVWGAKTLYEGGRTVEVRVRARRHLRIAPRL